MGRRTTSSCRTAVTVRYTLSGFATELFEMETIDEMIEMIAWQLPNTVGWFKDASAIKLIGMLLDLHPRTATGGSVFLTPIKPAPSKSDAPQLL